MKIQHISDVHCEFHSDKGARFVRELPVEGDVLVLPGDFATSYELVPTLSELCLRFPHVVHVCGNHEYYGTERGKVHNKLAKIAKRFDNFHPLNNNVSVIDGIRFVGTTLWWSASTVSPVDMLDIQNILYDYKAIRGYRRWVAGANLKAINFLRQNVEEGDIVVTHHAPSWLSKDTSMHGREYRPVDNCYYNNLDDMILEKRAKLWIHGHTHDHTDYTIGQTNVVSSPHGYAHIRGHFTGQCFLDRYSVIEV